MGFDDHSAAGWGMHASTVLVDAKGVGVRVRIQRTGDVPHNGPLRQQIGRGSIESRNLIGSARLHLIGGRNCGIEGITLAHGWYRAVRGRPSSVLDTLAGAASSRARGIASPSDLRLRA